MAFANLVNTFHMELDQPLVIMGIPFMGASENQVASFVTRTYEQPFTVGRTWPLDHYSYLASGKETSCRVLLQELIH